MFFYQVTCLIARFGPVYNGLLWTKFVQQTSRSQNPIWFCPEVHFCSIFFLWFHLLSGHSNFHLCKESVSIPVNKFATIYLCGVVLLKPANMKMWSPKGLWISFTDWDKDYSIFLHNIAIIGVSLVFIFNSSFFYKHVCNHLLLESTGTLKYLSVLPIRVTLICVNWLAVAGLLVGLPNSDAMVVQNCPLSHESIKGGE